MVKLIDPTPFGSVEEGIPFGSSKAPYSASNRHKGKDHKWRYLAPIKSREVHSPATGIVKKVVNDGSYSEGWGNHVDIHITDEAFVRLAHFATGTIKVKLNQTVKADQYVAQMGATGRTGGKVHLHEELWLKRNGKWDRVDPDAYRGASGKNVPGTPLVQPPKPTTPKPSVPKPAPAGSAKYDESRIALTAVNFRETPDGKIITTLKRGTIVKHNGESKGMWIRVQVGKRTGWVHASYFLWKRLRVASAKGLNLRALPSDRSKIIRGLPKGTVLNALDVKPGDKTRGSKWYLVMVGSQRGWVASAYVDPIR